VTLKLALMRTKTNHMRPLALLGLVVSLLLATIAVAVTREDVRSARNAQDRQLQAAVGSELALVASGERQITTALSLVLVNPAVQGLLGSPAPQARRADVASAALALDTIRRTSFMALSSACLDNGEGRQLVCSPGNAPGAFSAGLGREFLAIAANAPVGMASGAFLSPISHQPSVAFLAPIHLGGRLRGLAHLDFGIASALGSNRELSRTPGVEVALAGYGNGQLLLYGPIGARPGVSTVALPTHLSVHSLAAGGLPHHTLNDGHRALLASLPLKVGAGHHAVAVAATAIAANPSLINTWSPVMVAVLVLALLGLIASVAVLVSSNRRVTRELSTDSLTRLRNRRALMEELPRVCQRASEEKPAFMWFFDLNGFKRYNDSFGHLAGDTLLTRLGDRLREVVNGHGVVYRLGGDEFCVLVTAPVSDPHALFHDAREALTERGGAFTVSAAAGAVEIPREATEPTQALRLADQHMYREKASSQSGAAELITSVLHAALAQRHPDLGGHCDDVAGDVEVLARTIGLDQETTRLIVEAGDLHDIGKLGIPDAIITKAGPLSEQEWEFMRQHTVMGEQIIAAAGPSLQRIGPLVRASHERWDGRGYPDGLSGEEIPLGARIITICDSFRAMMDTRPYKPPMSLLDALGELRRCAGSQFYPSLVAVFCRLVEERSAPDRQVESTAG
jgi:diguanylate cyclase (GGDEF)-like protein